MDVWGHFKTVTKHRFLVMKHCFRVGLYKQGLLHDLSKYMPSEFLIGVWYYQGNRSPNNAEREAKGYSSSWLHHKGRNKHHYEYWIDYSTGSKKGMAGMKMPVKYVVEMFMDRVAASKTYKKDEYTNNCPLEYYEQGKAYHVIHEDSKKLLEKLLHMLDERGEEQTFCYIRKHILNKNV